MHCEHTACAVALTTPRSLSQRAQVARIAPRSWAQVATSFPRPSPGQVVTSLPGRDLLDDQARSRRQPHVATSLLPNQTNQVATSKWGRDTKYQQARSRPQNGVTTPMASVSSYDAKNRSPAQPGRDTNFWSQPQAGQSRSRP